MTPLIVLLFAYLLGGIPFGYLIVKLRSGRDVRDFGSGNIGATNVLRTSGRSAAIVTLVLDIAKGILAVWVADRFTYHDPLWMSAAALAVMAGHAFPVFLKFRGGKAVASFIGAFLYLAPAPMLAVLVIFLITVVASKYVSLGAIVAAGLFPFGVWLILHPPAVMVIAAAIAGAFIIYRHRANISRIRAGTESLFKFKSSR